MAWLNFCDQSAYFSPNHEWKAGKASERSCECMQVCMNNSNAHSSSGAELPLQLVGQLPPPPTCPFATADLTRPVSTAPTAAPARRHSIYSGEHLDWRGNGNAELRYKNPTRTYQPAFEYSYLTQVDGNWPKPLRTCKQTNENLITHWH